MTTVGAEAMSAREAEVLDGLRQHLTNAQIAQQLHISVRTVESHVSSLLRKLGAADRHDLAAQAETLAAAAPAEARPFTGLPSRWTTFIGRSTEIDEVTKAVETDRMITLLGPGGIGKTALATVVAERLAPGFSGGGAFVDLVPVAPAFVVEAVAAALGVLECPQVPLIDEVHERLRDGPVLLVLDNCEHVLAWAATFAQSVLASCPEAVVIATSRERLGVPGERVVAVPPLPLTALDDTAGSEAEALFLDRALSAGSSDTDPAVVAEICRRLDGMPLAIELAAARTGSLGIDGLLAGLDDRLRLLSSGPTGRHQSLRAVIDWSHDLLDPDEAAMFRRLAIFAGAFDLASAATVAGDGNAVGASDVVGRLADKSLLVHVRDLGGSRWRMLETVHDYAREQLEASGEVDGLRRSHLVWAADTAVALEQALDDTDGWKPTFDAVADDLRAALLPPEVTRDGVRYRLALALAHLSYARRYLVHARHHYESAVASAPSERAAVAALRQSADAAFAEMRGELAFQFLIQASELALTAADDATAALALADAANVGGRAPATFEVLPLHEDLVALVERAQSLAPPGNLEVAVHVGLAAAWNGSPLPTEPDPLLADRALALARELGDPVSISNALDAVAAAATAVGSNRLAWKVTAERLGLLDQMPRHDPRVGGEIADVYHMVTQAALAAGDLDAALGGAAGADADPVGQGLAHFAATHRVIPLVLQGRFDEALVHASAMEDGWIRTGRPAAGWMAPAFFATAMVHALRDEHDEYESWWECGRQICRHDRANSFQLFVEPRVALHRGDADLALATAMRPGQPLAGVFGAYAEIARVEAAVAAGAPDAEQQLANALRVAEENDFAAACRQRATGHLHQDEHLLTAAVTAFEAVGARFERACTMLLLPAREAEGRTELAAIGATAPVPLR